MRKFSIYILIAFLSLFETIHAGTTSLTLYDGTGLPSAGGALAGAAINSFGVPVAVGESTVTGGVQVDTDANGAEYSGYANQSGIPLMLVNAGFPTLDRTLGYSIFFNASLDSTTSASNDRAAFSVIAISSDNQGIELGFESGLIFAQNNGFTRGETSGAITTSDNISYELRVASSTYQLLADTGSGLTQILTGSLRTYTFNPATSSPPLPFNPYTTGNFVFFGDDTGQEDGVFTFRSASVTANTADAVPTLSEWGVIALVLGLACAAYQKVRGTELSGMA